MQENWQQLIDNFDQTQRYVLAAIVETKGSTYQKTGAHMLVNLQGECIGLLSGGCLEADIALHAKEVFQTGISQQVTYDLSANADLLWGLGLGCDGALIIQLQLLTPENEHRQFAQLLESVAQGQSGFYWLSTQQNQAANSVLNWFQVIEDSQQLSDIEQHTQNMQSQQADFQGLCIPVRAILSLVICGAGPDVAPVTEACKQQGWKVSLWDHRAPYLQQPVFVHVNAKRKVRPENISHAAEFNCFDGAILMTHNLTFDQQYLAQLLQSSVGYIGVLGPKARLNKLVNNIEQQRNVSLTAALTKNGSPRVYGPIGLDLGGRGPQAIALSIAAQIQQHFYQQEESAKPNKTGSNTAQRICAQHVNYHQQLTMEKQQHASC